MTTRVNASCPGNAPGGEAILRSMFRSVTNGRAMNDSRTHRHELLCRAKHLLPAIFLALRIANSAGAQPVAESLGDRILRFWPDSSARANGLPSRALLPQVHGEVPAGGFWVQAGDGSDCVGRV